MDFFEAGRKGGSFDDGIELVLARVLSSPQFIYRIEEEPPRRRARRDGPAALGQVLSHQRPRPRVAAVVLPLEQQP